MSVKGEWKLKLKSRDPEKTARGTNLGVVLLVLGWLTRKWGLWIMEGSPTSKTPQDESDETPKAINDEGGAIDI